MSDQQLITMEQAENMVPVDWIINCMASGILLDHDADPDFYATVEDIPEFEKASPSLAHEMVMVANDQGLTMPPNTSDDNALQEYDRKVRDVAKSVMERLPENEKQAIASLVMSRTEE